jgi:hypothetical protein
MKRHTVTPRGIIMTLTSAVKAELSDEMGEVDV